MKMNYKAIRVYILFFALGIVIPNFLSAQIIDLKIKSPIKDSVHVTTSKVYFQGVADPSGFLFFGNQPVKIYSTGVFAHPISLNLGRNEWVVKYGKNQDTLFRKIIFEYTPVAKALPTEGFQIEKISFSQGGDLWLGPSDKLQIEVKATPGMNLSFFKNIPLNELDEKQAGVSGIYRGEYTIQSQDEWNEQAVKVIMKDPKSQKTLEKLSTQKVKFLTQHHSIIGVTTSTRVGLNYGLGADRLGGAKMGFLENNIPLVITGKMQGMYRVQLSDQTLAYVNENELQLLKGIQFRPQSLTGSWSVQPSDKGDLIHIGLSQKLPYVSQMLENPSKIIVDIYGASSNSNWITQKEDLKAIKNVWYEQLSHDVFRIHIELLKDQHWGHEIQYIGNSLQIRVKPTPKSLNLNQLTIAVDAGHGGTNLGAIGMTGVLEKDLNLEMATRLSDLLAKRGVNVVLTRPGNSYTTNTKRLETLKDLDPDLLISIHCNAAGNPMAHGTSSYYRHQAFRPLSKFIHKEMLKLGLGDFGNVGGFNFTLNAPIEYPSVLVEVAFMSNPADEERLLDPEFYDQVANSILKGLEKFLDSSKK